MFSRRFWILGLIIVLAACSRPWTETSIFTPVPVDTLGPAPTVATLVVTPSISYTLPTLRPTGAPVLTPTPDSPHYQAGVARGPETYVVQSGDMLSAIAERFSVSIDAIVQANNISNPDALEVGQTLTIPVVTPQAPGPAYKLIPDSELVYGPLSSTLDIAAFIQAKGGYLARYTHRFAISNRRLIAFNFRTPAAGGCRTTLHKKRLMRHSK